jgi:hypothetical protein
MRAAMLASVLVFTASAAAAGPLVAAPAHLMLPSQDRMTAEFATRGNGDPMLIGSRANITAPQTGFSIESVRIETSDDPRPGRHRQTLQYRLQGVSVLGGSIGGSLGSGAPVLSLHWPTGQ